MVMDFSFIKEEMMKCIHEVIDHGLILWKDDYLRHALTWDPQDAPEMAGDWSVTPDHLSAGLTPEWGLKGIKLYLMEDVPTAENMAKHFFEVLGARILFRSGKRARIAQLDVYETPNCLARYPAVPVHDHPAPYNPNQIIGPGLVQGPDGVMRPNFGIGLEGHNG